jgi:hypothetical protein
MGNAVPDPSKKIERQEHPSPARDERRPCQIPDHRLYVIGAVLGLGGADLPE